jgi:hypothetical protein
VEQQIVQRCVGQHDADLRQIGRHGGVDFPGNRPDQYDRALWRHHQGCFGVGDPGDAARAGQVGDHQGEGFAVALLQRPQAADRAAVPGIAGQMEAAQALQCHDFTGAQARQDLLDPYGELRAAGRAGGRLGMEAAVARIMVFARSPGTG